MFGLFNISTNSWLIMENREIFNLVKIGVNMRYIIELLFVNIRHVDFCHGGFIFYLFA